MSQFYRFGDIRRMLVVLFIVMLFVSPSFCATSPFIAVTNSFGADPSTGFGFSWSMASSVKESWIEYCPASTFKSFTGETILRSPAKSSISQNDIEKRKIFKVQLKDLKPATVYTYRLVASDGSVSPQATFRTAEVDSEAFTFLSVTDTQGSNAKDYALWGTTLKSALKHYPDARFLMHTGDIVDHGDSVLQWDAFVQAAQDMLLNLPIEPAVGNHDTSNSNSSNALIRNFTDLFSTPQVENAGAVLGTAYAFDYGDAHVAVMNTQCGSKNLKAQAEWLLQNMNQSHKTWKIVALHRGPYGGIYDSTDIRREWEPVFSTAGVDLVLEGHDHNYIRTYPMKNGEIVKAGEGTVYMDGNASGVKFYETKARTWQAVDLQPHKQMYLAIAVERQTLTVKAYDVENKLIDSVRFEKPVEVILESSVESSWLMIKVEQLFHYENLRQFWSSDRK